MNDRLHLYLRHKTLYETAGWLLLFGVLTAINIVTTWWDVQRRALAFAAWEVVSWEVSSNVVWLACVPAIAWMVDRYPPLWQRPGAIVARHACAACGLSLVHVAGMVAIRKAVYVGMGSRYAFGDLGVELPYEVVKDVRTYAFTAGVILFYRLALWRLRGEGSLIDQAAPVPSPAPALPGHDKLLVKRRGREFLVALADVDRVQAEGNYVKLYWDGGDVLLRSSLSAFQEQAKGRFVRVHRSWLVSLAHVKSIEANEFGDAKVHLASTAAVPCSRTYLDGLRRQLAGGRPGAE